MKRLLLYISLALAICPAFSQNTLVIHQKDGQKFSFGFDDKPVITYTDNDLVLKTAKTEVQYPLASLSKFTFVDIPTEVDAVAVDRKSPEITLDDYMIRITGAKAETVVKVTGMDGKTLAAYKADSEGTVTFSIADLPEGVYIISSDSLTCKILKK